MTVRELIKELQERDPEALVYVPWSPEGKNGLLAYVCRCSHTNLPAGITVSDDVALVPMQMEDFVHETEEDRA